MEGYQYRYIMDIWFMVSLTRIRGMLVKLNV